MQLVLFIGVYELVLSLTKILVSFFSKLLDNWILFFLDIFFLEILFSNFLLLIYCFNISISGLLLLIMLIPLLLFILYFPFLGIIDFKLF